MEPHFWELGIIIYYILLSSISLLPTDVASVSFAHAFLLLLLKTPDLGSLLIESACFLSVIDNNFETFFFLYRYPSRVSSIFCFVFLYFLILFSCALNKRKKEKKKERVYTEFDCHKWVWQRLASM